MMVDKLHFHTKENSNRPCHEEVPRIHVQERPRAECFIHTQRSRTKILFDRGVFKTLGGHSHQVCVGVWLFAGSSFMSATVYSIRSFWVSKLFSLGKKSIILANTFTNKIDPWKPLKIELNFNCIWLIDLRFLSYKWNLGERFFL